MKRHPHDNSKNRSVGLVGDKHFQYSVALTERAPISSSHPWNNAELKIVWNQIDQFRSIEAELSPSFGIYITVGTFFLLENCSELWSREWQEFRDPIKNPVFSTQIGAEHK